MVTTLVPKTRTIHAIENEISDCLKEGRRTLMESAERAKRIGECLIEAKAQLPHGEYLPWATKRFGFTRQATSGFVRVALRWEEVLAQMESGLSVWSALPRLSSGDLHVSTGEDEWYTPKETIEAVREVMGEIDLDPASSKEAQKVVKAVEWWGEEDNGLEQKWSGRVFLNPPFGMPLVEQFINKALAEWEAGHVKEIIVLTNNATDTEWFRKIGAVATMGFSIGRVQFWNPDREAQPRQGQAYFYLGKREDKFRHVFGKAELAWGFVKVSRGRCCVLADGTGSVT